MITQLTTTYITPIGVIIFGGIIGSFLNVCIFRLPREKSIILPPSSCPTCHNKIRFYDNIPILSYLILKGKCRVCGSKIALRYPLVEFLTIALFFSLYLKFGLSLEFAVNMLFVSLLIVISFIDIDFKIIPDVLSLGGMATGFILSFFRYPFGYLDSLIGIFIGGGILYGIAIAYGAIAKREGMGGGDIKLLGMIGAFSGIKGVLFTLMAGSLIGSIVGIILMLTQGKDMKYALPFGPFLSLGAIIYIFSGDYLEKGFVRLITGQ
ncbi:MAG: prepilin peptidase [Syntrophorhabdaceae bacterium]|nr:prepilin peptidase [Syntrophorhabdaceae bacterium]